MFCIIGGAFGLSNSGVKPLDLSVGGVKFEGELNKMCNSKVKLQAAHRRRSLDFMSYQVRRKAPAFRHGDIRRFPS